MSDQETSQPREDEDVELHRRRAQKEATEEPKAEGDAEDDVELHRRSGGQKA